MFVANPISGAAQPYEFIAGPWGEIGQFFVPGAGSSLIRQISFFPDASVTSATGPRSICRSPSSSPSAPPDSAWGGAGYAEAGRLPMLMSSTVAVVGASQHPPPLEDSSSSKSPDPPHTPESGRVSSTRAADSWSPAISATTD